MTDTNEEIWKKIKRIRPYAISNDRAWITIEKDEHDWLIQEVEQLRIERDLLRSGVSMARLDWIAEQMKDERLR